MPRGGRLLVAALSATILAAAAPASAEGPGLRPAPARKKLIHRRGPVDGLTRAERSELLNGGVVSRPLALERSDGSYVGGVSYQLVRAAPQEVLAALSDVSRLPEVLPRTQSARFVDESAGRRRIELTQGNGIASASYTAVLVADGPSTIRFWLDPSRPHGIRDVFGYFRVEAFDDSRSLITVAAAVDVGPGLVRMLFESRIQRLVLDTPRHIRDYIEPRAIAAR